MNKLNLILDLDGTIIYSKILINNTKKKYKKIVNKYMKKDCFLHKIDRDENNCCIVYHRPFLKEFLTDLYECYNIYIYTFGSYDYAKAIVTKIIEYCEFNPFIKIYCVDPSKISGLIAGNVFKIINTSEVDISKTIVMDDNINVWKYNKNSDKINYNINFIKIKPFVVDKTNSHIFDITLLNNKKILNALYDYYILCSETGELNFSIDNYIFYRNIEEHEKNLISYDYDVNETIPDFIISFIL